MITFEALRKTGKFTIIIIWGKQNQPEMMQILNPIPYAKGQIQKATLHDLRIAVSKWFQYVNKTFKKEV